MSKSRSVEKILESSVPHRFELSQAQREQLQNVAAVTLAIVGAAGAVVLSAVAPNVIGAIGQLAKLQNKKTSFKENSRKAAKTFYYLRRSGFIKMKKDGVDWRIFLTALGKKRLQKLDMHTLQVPQPKPWDGKWWQVAANIPTREFRRGADLLRKKLREMGFYPLQRTLWFYPYDPRAVLEFIVTTFHIGRFVTVMEVSRLDKEDEVKLKAFFSGKL